MEENKEKGSEIVVKEEPRTQNPVFSLLSNFLGFLQLNRGARPEAVAAAAEESTGTKPAVVEETKDRNSMPDFVKVPYTQQIISPLKLEAEELERSSSPAVLWQVYAFGGYIILRWVWARWNERRRAKNESSDEEQYVADD